LSECLKQLQYVIDYNDSKIVIDVKENKALIDKFFKMPLPKEHYTFENFASESTRKSINNFG
jgi:hypothetical protein